MAMMQVDDENTIRDSLLDNVDDSNTREEEEEDLPDVPLEPYKSYAKFACRFAKWILSLCIFDIVAMVIHDESYGEPWRASFEAGVFILHTIFFFLAARAIDRDVAKVDEEFQSQEQSGTENPPMDWNNYENIYGKAARKIDVWLASACRTQPVTTEERPTGTTSFLSHVCWILWAFSLASAFSMSVDQAYQKVFPEEGIGESVTNTSSTFSNISHFPGDVQKWITVPEFYDESKFDFPATRGDFVSAYLDDRLLFSVGSRWSIHHDTSEGLGLGYGFTELVMSNGRLERRVHKDILLPHHSIPVQSSISKDDELRASQYCFLSRGGHQFKIDWCTDKAHCIDSSKMENGKDLILENITLDWHVTKEMLRTKIHGRGCSEYDFRMEAASYQNLVFFKKMISHYNFGNCHEVIQVDPATMETSTIFHQRCRLRRNDRYGPGDSFNLLRFLNGILGLVFASYYLIAKLGMVSGVFPLCYAFSFVLDAVLTDEFFSILFLTMGTGFLLYSIVTDRKWGNLPAWIGKDVYTWALYGWISSNTLLPFVPSYFFWTLLGWKVAYLCMSALILGHPITQMFGYILVISGVLEIILNFNWFLMDPMEMLGTTMSGLGLAVFGNWVTAHKEVIYARGKHVVWYLTKWFGVRFRRNISRR